MALAKGKNNKEFGGRKKNVQNMQSSVFYG